MDIIFDENFQRAGHRRSGYYPDGVNRVRDRSRYRGNRFSAPSAALSRFRALERIRFRHFLGILVTGARAHGSTAGAILQTAAAMEVLLDQASEEAAHYILSVANQTVPYDTGALHDSGQVIRGADGAWLVYYGEEYAEIQHERLDFVHAPGRRAQWLARTIEEEQDAVLGIFASYTGDALTGAGGVGGSLQGFGGSTRFISPPVRSF